MTSKITEKMVLENMNDYLGPKQLDFLDLLLNFGQKNDLVRNCVLRIFFYKGRWTVPVESKK